jgi:hypothetical protein
MNSQIKEIKKVEPISGLNNPTFMSSNRPKTLFAGFMQKKRLEKLVQKSTNSEEKKSQEPVSRDKFSYWFLAYDYFK